MITLLFPLNLTVVCVVLPGKLISGTFSMEFKKIKAAYSVEEFSPLGISQLILGDSLVSVFQSLKTSRIITVMTFG